MLQIFIAMASVVMAALLLVAGISSVDTSSMTRKQVRLQVEGSQAALLRAFDAYRIANGGAPPDLTVTDGRVPEAIAPYIAAPPTAPEGMVWTYASDSAGAYACLHGDQVSKATVDGLMQVPAYDPTTIVASRCADTVASAPRGGPAAFRFALH